MSEALKKAVEEGKCCICEDPLKGSHVNLVQLAKKATWKHPVWGNIFAPEAGMRALALACDNCVNTETGIVREQPKFAIELDGNVIRYHAVDSLKDAESITEEMVAEGEKRFAHGQNGLVSET